MKKIASAPLIFLALLVTITMTLSCSKSNEGCTSAQSFNFDPDADVDDGSCVDLTDFLIGEWIAISYTENMVEFIGNTLNSFVLTLSADGTIDIEAIQTNLIPLNSAGTWTTTWNNFNLQFDLASSEFKPCPGLEEDYRFAVSIISPDFIELLTTCQPGGEAILVRLQKN